MWVIPDFSKHGTKTTCDSAGKTTNREATAADTEGAELLRNRTAA